MAFLMKEWERYFAYSDLKETQSIDVESVKISGLNQDLSTLETIQVRALEWLSFDPIQRQDALFKCNQLMRSFLRKESN